MKTFLFSTLVALMLTGCYTTDYKDAAFLAKEALKPPPVDMRERGAMSQDESADSRGPVALKCDSFREATCPDRVTSAEVFTPILAFPIIVHSDLLRRMSNLYSIEVHNLPDDFSGCALADFFVNRVMEGAFDHTNIDRDLIVSMTNRVNVFGPLPRRRCWSDIDSWSGVDFREMRAKAEGTRMINMLQTTWENEDVQY